MDKPKDDPPGTTAFPLAFDDACANRLLALTAWQNEVYTTLLVDGDGCIRWQGGAVEKMFGYGSGELIGKPMDVLFMPEDVARGIPDQEREWSELRNKSEDDRWMLRADGSAVWVEGMLVAVRDDAGALLAHAKLMRNRTEAREHLLTLRNQRDALGAADERKNAGLAKVAHELRDPLSAIANATVVLQGLADVSDSRISAVLAVLSRQTDRLRRLTDQLLDAARAGASAVHVLRQTVSMQEAIADAVQMATGNAPLARIELLLLPVPVEIVVDPLHLQQMLGNLIGNAIKYTPTGEPIWVTLGVEGAEAIVRVADCGIGIAPDMQARIFDMFTQADSTPAAKGLGIGLAVVKDLVTLHAGSVQVQSDGIGKGSIFTLRLPLLPGQTASDDEAVMLSSSAEGVSSAVATRLDRR